MWDGGKGLILWNDFVLFQGVMLSHDNLTFTAKLATSIHKFDIR